MSTCKTTVARGSTQRALPGTVWPVKPPEKWLTRTDAAEVLRVTPKAIDNYVRAGKLRKYSLLGGRPRFRSDDVHSLIDGPGEEKR